MLLLLTIGLNACSHATSVNECLLFNPIVPSDPILSKIHSEALQGDISAIELIERIDKHDTKHEELCGG